MRQIRTLLFLLLILLVPAVKVTAHAQEPEKTVSGVVSDNCGPMMEATVYERDSVNHIVSIALTDMEGKFSLRVQDFNDRMEVTYRGYDTVVIPLDTCFYEIKLKALDTPQEVLILDGDASGLIPLNDSAPTPSR